MKPGDYIIFNKSVSEDYAIKYCNDAGVYLGGVCLYLEDKDDATVIIRTSVDTEFGRIFVRDHFKKSHRLDNLEKLLS